MLHEGWMTSIMPQGGFRLGREGGRVGEREREREIFQVRERERYFRLEREISG